MYIDSIKARISNLLLQELKHKTVPPFDTTLRNAGIDSLDYVELVMIVEGEFEISISNQEMANVSKLQDLVELVNIKLNG